MLPRLESKISITNASTEETNKDECNMLIIQFLILWGKG